MGFNSGFKGLITTKYMNKTKQKNCTATLHSFIYTLVKIWQCKKQVSVGMQ